MKRFKTGDIAIVINTDNTGFKCGDKVIILKTFNGGSCYAERLKDNYLQCVNADQIELLSEKNEKDMKSQILDFNELADKLTGILSTNAKVVKNAKMVISKTPAKKVAVKKVAAAKKVKSAIIPISRTRAWDLMKNNKGRFFTATFIKKDLTSRTINGQYLKDQEEPKLGYLKVVDLVKKKKSPTNCIRNINLQTLTHLKIAGNSYRIR